MIEKIVRASLQERLIVLVFAIALLVAGFFGVKKLTIDAFPDVTNIQVQIATPHPCSTAIRIGCRPTSQSPIKWWWK